MQSSGPSRPTPAARTRTSRPFLLGARAASASLVVGGVLASCGVVGHALAQGVGQKAAAAEELFREARRLMAAGDLAQACPKFAASQRLDPGMGTLINLADCHEQEGKLASAWAEFLEVVSLARAAKDSRRLDVAKARAAALEPRLARLSIVVPPAARVDGLQITRDGDAVDPATFDTPLPVDKGEHVIVATAPRRKRWSQTLRVSNDAARETLTIPVLVVDDAPAPATSASSGPTLATSARPAPPAPTASAAASTAPPASPTQAPAPSSTGRTAGFVLGGIGVAGLAVGTVAGLIARSRWATAQDDCPDLVCPTEAAQNNARSSRAFAFASTLSFAVGGALAASGVALVLVSPSNDASTALRLTPTLGPSLGGLSLDGAF